MDTSEIWQLIIVVVSAIVSILALICSIKSYLYARNRGKTEEAIELAKYFQEEILKDVSSITNMVQWHEKMWKKINRLDANNFEKFTYIEFKAICPDYDDVDVLIDFLKAKTMDVTILANIYMIDQEDKFHNPPQFPSDRTLFENMLKNHYNCKILNLLNKLEYFSMSLVYNTADEKVLYQSLHQTFLLAVKLLYPIIADSNRAEIKDLYYINTIELFKKWRDRDRKISLTNDKAVFKSTEPRPKIKR